VGRRCVRRSRRRARFASCLRRRLPYGHRRSDAAGVRKIAALFAAGDGDHRGAYSSSTLIARIVTPPMHLLLAPKDRKAKPEDDQHPEAVGGSGRVGHAPGRKRRRAHVDFNLPKGLVDYSTSSTASSKPKSSRWKMRTTISASSIIAANMRAPTGTRWTAASRVGAIAARGGGGRTRPDISVLRWPRS